MLAQMGPANDKVVLKNKKGQILKSSPNKWSNDQKKGIKSRFLAPQLKPSSVHMASRLRRFRRTTV